MVEPTGLWQEEISQGIEPYLQALVKVLCRHLQVKQPDDDVYRLALCIVAQAVFLYMGRDVLVAVRPRLLSDAEQLDVMQQRLVQYALAMVHGEQERRRQNHIKRKAP